MMILRVLLAIPCFLLGGFFALISLVVGCTVQNQAMTDGSATQWFLFLQGLPPSIGVWIVGVVGMLLIGCGLALIDGAGRRR
jgi:predicted MFS family arabinose efflux permease